MTVSVFAIPKGWATSNRIALAVALGIGAFVLSQLDFPAGDPWVSALWAVILVCYAVYVLPEALWAVLAVTATLVGLAVAGQALESLTARDVGFLLLAATLFWAIAKIAKLEQQAQFDRLYMQDKLSEMSMRLTDAGVRLSPSDDDETEWSPEEPEGDR